MTFADLEEEEARSYRYAVAEDRRELLREQEMERQDKLRRAQRKAQKKG